MKAKKWNFLVIGGVLIIFGVWGLVTAIIDPFMHYHGGIEGLEYPLLDERYQNDGIARHYEYDSIITGTSMCQNFKTSEFEALWGGKTIKITNSGASYHETGENIRRAYVYRPDVKYVLASMDGNQLNTPADADTYEGYPDYLYDQNPFNDVKYLLNKDVIPKTIAVLNYTLAGNHTTTMDEYGFWGSYKSYGKESVRASFDLVEESTEEYFLTEADKQKITENVTKNFLELANQHPDTTFYFFFPPYSICYWEALVRTNQLEAQIEAQKLAVEVLLTAENIEVYDFSSKVEITGNLDNYTDTLHYGPWINSEILEMIKGQEGRLMDDSYVQYYEELKKIYSEYDYSLYKQ